ncbi:MAG: hemolysin III family protein [Spirochaetales bacterium]|nr:hemolysin III family protein [Spirochaetales bacterium]
MSRQDDIAAKAVRKSTLKSLKAKKHGRLVQLKKDYEQAVREINIQYDEDPERLKAKYAAEDYAKTEKAKKRAQKKIEIERKIIENSKKIRPLTLAEEISSSIVQGIGVSLFIAGTAVLDTIAVGNLKSWVNITTVFYTLFGAAMILMYLFSLLQHSITNITAKTVFNRLSHVWTFLIIGFGYSVYAITKIEGLKGWILFGIVWSIVLIGILFYSIAGRKHEKLNIILCILAGFSGIFVANNLYDALSTQSFTMLILAGVFYLIGIVFYSLRKVKFMHLIGNISMLIGSVFVFFSLFFIGM